MAVNTYKCPPQPASGQGTFSDNLVGLQLTQGGGLTQGNFTFTTSFTEKSNNLCKLIFNMEIKYIHKYYEYTKHAGYSYYPLAYISNNVNF